MDNEYLRQLYQLLLHLRANLMIIKDVSHEPTFDEMRELKQTAETLEDATSEAIKDIGDRLDNSSEETQ